MRPEKPGRSATNAAREHWRRACDAYDQARSSDPEYRQATSTFEELQRHEPQPLSVFEPGVYALWAYRDKVLRLESTEPGVSDENVLAIKHFVLRREQQYERMRREVEALENMEKLQGVSREPIPDKIRLFVWQRDKGQCVKCGTRERLEFDHIIPVAEGGSSTERNVQLLCEACNRSKGARI